MTSRRLFVWLHRWTGLAMAGFLIIVGLTGSLLAFNTELERIFAPQLFAKPRPGVAPLDLATLAERAQALVPQRKIASVTYQEPDQVSVSFEPRNGLATEGESDLNFTDFFVDPWTGEELGRRRNADLSQGFVNLMPFIYDLHWRLAVGDVGQWIVGTVALFWTIDCFIAFYLTLPLTTATFWRRWKPAWFIKANAGFFRLNFDLHRASGLWLWGMLFIFAWSSVMMNLRFIYEPVMQTVFDFRPYQSPPQRLARMQTLDWRAAKATGERLIAEQGASQGFEAKEPLSLMYAPDANAYTYMVRGSHDLFERSPKGGGTSVTFDGDSGALIEVFQPTGQHSGNTIESWLYALHMARIFGLLYRIFVCALGLVVAILSVTGVYIWWKKRSARVAHVRRKTPQAATVE